MGKKPQRGPKKKPGSLQIPTSAEQSSTTDATSPSHLDGIELEHDHDGASVASEQAPSVHDVDDGATETTEDDNGNREHYAQNSTSLPLDPDQESRQDTSQPKPNGVHVPDTDSSLNESRLQNIIDTLQSERESLMEQVESMKSDRDSAQEQYSQLRGKVSKITAQLSTKIHNYENTISESNERIVGLEDDKIRLEASVADLERKVSTVSLEKSQLTTEIDLLRSRSELSHSNWSKEREEFGQRERQLLDDLNVAEQAKQDWEVLAMEERAQREALSDRLAEYEDQLGAQREALSRSHDDCQVYNETVTDLQRALSEVQNAHRSEFRDRVEKSEEQILSLKRELSTAEETAKTTLSQLEVARAELSEKAPLEKDVKEKRLQIGKLRHEAVILNDHLIKALRFLKQRKPEEMVDREIVTNHFLHFLALDRSDPKKFQILQLIAALLSWSDEQKEQAGIFRPGTTFSSNLPRTPSGLIAPGSASLMSSFSLPFRRPSAANPPSESSQSQTGHLPPPSPGFLRSSWSPNNRETLAELWSAFLEREANEGGSGSGGGEGGASGRSVSSAGGPGIASPLDTISVSQASESSKS